MGIEFFNDGEMMKEPPKNTYRYHTRKGIELLCVRNGKNKRVVHPSYVKGETTHKESRGLGEMIPQWYTESICGNFRADSIDYEYRDHEVMYLTEEEIMESDEICKNCKEMLR